ncbi:MAG: hypothetical protein ACI8RZ_000769 [Myxococcota bacterium]|jgi:hypothetical protein
MPPPVRDTFTISAALSAPTWRNFFIALVLILVLVTAIVFGARFGAHFGEQGTVYTEPMR